MEQSVIALLKEWGPGGITAAVAIYAVWGLINVARERNGQSVQIMQKRDEILRREEHVLNGLSALGERLTDATVRCHESQMMQGARRQEE